MGFPVAERFCSCFLVSSWLFPKAAALFGSSLTYRKRPTSLLLPSLCSLLSFFSTLHRSPLLEPYVCVLSSSPLLPFLFQIELIPSDVVSRIVLPTSVPAGDPLQFSERHSTSLSSCCCLFLPISRLYRYAFQGSFLFFFLLLFSPPVLLPLPLRDGAGDAAR